MTKRLHFKGTNFHLIIKGFMAQVLPFLSLSFLVDLICLYRLYAWISQFRRACTFGLARTNYICFYLVLNLCTPLKYLVRTN